jgi:hypothetical protein
MEDMFDGQGEARGRGEIVPACHRGGVERDLRTAVPS